MMTAQDKEQLARKGITETQIAEQLECFRKGFPFLKLDSAASAGSGVLSPASEEQKAYLNAWDEYKSTDKKVIKFVPASGAASRMFKDLFEFLSAERDEPPLRSRRRFSKG
ncbi:ribosylnicotinamide kinase homolog [Bacteroides pyogenes JCM 10003]|nr:ribosylnicotinamide kinase homolog [Bacteroides pyogenes JCM 10003]